jgi:hypothetical protein
MATYTIKSGDTLGAIAKKNNTTVDALMKANPSITDPNKIYAGKGLAIPTTTTPVKTTTPTVTTTPKATTVTPVKTTTISPVVKAVSAVTNSVKPSTTPVTPTTGTIGAAGAAKSGTTAGTVTNQPVSTGTAAVDSTIQGYKDQYAAAQAKGDNLGMLQAAEAADKYRVSQGQPATNAAQIERLKSQLTPEQQLKYTSGQQGDLTNKILNFDETYTEDTSKEEFMSEITGYINSLLKQQSDQAAANTAKSRNTLLTDADIAKTELDDTFNQQLQELAAQADKIRAAYTTSKANIETEKNKNLPTFDTTMNQQDILSQRQSKQIGEEFAQRGLQAGGQVTSELGQNAQTNLTEVGKIAGQKQNYIADVANDLAALETEQATGLADTARMQSTAAQNLSSGKASIIKKVNAALSNLSIDETTLLNSLAEQRTQMLYNASQEYRDLSKQEKDDAFNRMLQQAGVAADSVNTIRQLIDDKNEADMAALEYKIKELELQNLSKTQKLELEKLKQDIKQGNASISQNWAQLKLQQDKFKFDKEQELNAKQREQYNNYIDMVDTSSFISKDADGVTQVNDKTGLRNYIIGLNLDDDVTDSLLLRYGLPTN